MFSSLVMQGIFYVIFSRNVSRVIVCGWFFFLLCLSTFYDDHPEKGSKLVL